MIAYETSTTTITNVNTAITTTTTIPAPTNTATLAIYKTTTTPEQPDHVTDTRHVIALPTQVEIKLTTTATDPKSTITMNEQQDNEEPAVGENEEKRGVKTQEEMSEREVERRETDAGEWERIEETQSEVQDPAASPTAHADATAPTSPSAKPAVPAPVLIHPAFTIPVDPNPDNPIPVRIMFANPVPSNLTPTPFVHPIPADSATADSGPVTCVNTFDIMPTNHVHVDPMLRTLITLLIHQALISASLLVYSMNFTLASRTHANAVLLMFCFVLFSSFGV
jgi:hypothetical protein